MGDPTVEEPAPQLLVIHVFWTEGGTPRSETYGPWTAAQDESHLEQVSTFIRGWHRLNGSATAVSATLAVVTDPERFTEAGIVPGILPDRGWTPEELAEFEERWNALHGSPPAR